MKKVSSCYTDHCFNKIIEGFKKWRGFKSLFDKLFSCHEQVRNLGFWNEKMCKLSNQVQCLSE